jgi:hypothetical protein
MKAGNFSTVPSQGSSRAAEAVVKAEDLVQVDTSKGAFDAKGSRTTAWAVGGAGVTLALAAAMLALLRLAIASARAVKAVNITFFFLRTSSHPFVTPILCMWSDHTIIRPHAKYQRKICYFGLAEWFRTQWSWSSEYPVEST